MSHSTVAPRLTSARFKNRLLRGGALFGALLLTAVAVTQGATVAPAHAATAPFALRCDQNTVYGITSGTAGHVVAIDVSPGVTTASTTDLPSFGTANNALGVAPDGLSAYATVNANATTSTGTISKYDAQTGEVTTIGNVPVPDHTYRGAVNPVNNIYYYAQGNVASAALYAYDTVNNRALGLVGHINGLAAMNGDFAFSTSGLLYVVSGDDVMRVDSAIPTVSGDAPLSTTKIASLPTGTNSPGIAFSSDGYLYIATLNGTLVELNPSSGTPSTPVRTIAISGGATMYDLATCNYPDSIQAKASVDQRWQSGDQFALAVTGNGISLGNTATTAGSATGTQPQTAGTNLAVPGADYTVTQSVPNGSTTVLSNYSTKWSCTNAKTNAVIASGDGNSGTFQVPPVAAGTTSGTDVSCLFTNKLIAVHSAAVNDGYSTASGTALSINAPGVLGNDAGTSATVTGHTNPGHGTLSIQASGAFVYTPTPGYAGPDSFTYTITDSAGVTSTATVNLVVGPIAVDDQGAVVDGSSLTTTASSGGVLANDSGVGLSAALSPGASSQPAHGSVTLRSDGSYIYTPTVKYSGPDQFTYTVTDQGGHTGQAVVHLTVSPLAVNDTLPSTTVDTVATIPVDPSLSNDLGTGTGSGANGLAVVSVGPKTTGSATTGTVQLSSDKTSFVYTPKAGASGLDSFLYTITDGTNTSTAVETIRVLPVAAAYTVPATPANTQETISAATLTGLGKGTPNLTIQGVSSLDLGTVTLSPDKSTITFTPTAGASGTGHFSYTVVDPSSGVSAPAVVTVPVSARGFDDTLPGTAVGQSKNYDSTSFTGNDIGSNLVVTSVGQPAAGTGSTSVATVDGVTTVTYTPPTAAYSGPVSFTYTATGDDGSTSSATASFTVLPTAGALVATVTSGQANTIPAPGLLTNATGSGLKATAPSTSQQGGSITVATDGSYVYTPKANYSGQDSFTYTVTDSTGGTATNTVTVTVLPKARVDTLPAVEPGTSTIINESDLLKNDAGSNLSVTAITQPTNGTVVDNGDGTLAYTTSGTFFGQDAFTYTISDGSNSSTATVRTTVGVAAPDFSNTVDAGATLQVLPQTTGSLLTQAQIAGGVTIVTNGGSTPRHGGVTFTTDGGYTYTPAPLYSGVDTFTYETIDQSNDTSFGTVTITVTPKAFPDAVTIVSGGTGHLDATGVLKNDQGRGLNVTSVGGPANPGNPGDTVATAAGGAVVIQTNGTLDYTPPAGFSGTDSVQYTLTDGAHQTSTTTVTFTVTPQAVADDLDPIAANSTVTLPKAVFVGNDLGQGRTVSAVGAPASSPTSPPALTAKGGTVSVDAAGTVTYTPKKGFSGRDSFPYTLQDGSLQTAIATATIRVLPTITPIATTAVSGTPDVVLKGDGLLSTAVGSGLVIAITGSPVAGSGQLAFDATGAFVFTPASTYSGTQVVTYTVTDGDGGQATGSLTITVKPKAYDDIRPSAAAGATQTIAQSTVLGNDTGSGLRITGFDQTTVNGGHVTRGTDGGFVYRPADGYSGPDSFTYAIADSPAGSPSSATVFLTVTPVAKRDSITTSVGTQVAAPASGGVLANDLGQGLSIVAHTDAKNGKLTLQSNGAYTYAPKAGYSGPDSFTYTVIDSSNQTSKTTVAIRITPTALTDHVSTPSDTVLHVAAAGVLGNDQGSSVSVTSVGAAGRAGGVIATPDGNRLVIRADGSFDFVPADGYSGIDEIPYGIVDAYGGTATSALFVTVKPVALADAFETPANTPLAIQPAVLTGNDVGSKLHVTSAQQPGHGTLVANADGTYTYTPKHGFSGTDEFRYTATDQAGQKTSSIVRIVVGDLASDYGKTTKTGDAIGVDAAHGLLSADEGMGLTATLDAKPSHGTVVVSPDGSYVYTPAKGFSGFDTFTYQVKDASGQIRTGTVTVKIVPTAAPDKAATTVGHSVTVSTPGVLGNDLGTSLRVTATGSPAHGTATLSPAGALVYTPAKGFSGVDTFVYTVTDSSGLTATSRVTVTVGIVALPAHGTTIESETLHVAAPAGLLSAASGTGLSAAAATQPKHGTVVVARDGSYTYTPKAGFVGRDSFTYRVTDASGQVATATVTVTVLPRAAAHSDHAQGTPGKPVTLTPLANDTPSGGATLDASSLTLLDPATGKHVTSFSIDGKGTFSVIDGRVTFVPVGSFAGTASIRYHAVDTDGIGVRSVITVVYPLLPAIAKAAAAPATGVLAFTGSAPVAPAAVIALLGIALGIGLTVLRRRRSKPLRSRGAHRA